MKAEHELGYTGLSFRVTTSVNSCTND